MTNKTIPFSMSGEYKVGAVVEQLLKLIPNFHNKDFDYESGSMTITRIEAGGQVHFKLTSDLAFTVPMPKPEVK